jgi:hypothetical protein
MAKLNIENTRKALQSFDFKTLFIEELGWSNPSTSKVINETIKDIVIIRKPIAELSGAVVFEITTPTGNVPEPKERAIIAKEIQKQHYEHVLIFVDSDRKQSIWHWLKHQDKKLLSREHFYFRHQPGDGFIAKIASLVVDISEFDREGNIAIAEVASRIKSALDIERVVKKFFREYQQEYIVFLDLIEGIDNEADRRWYASVILNRLMFIYFLQKKLFVDNGNANYLNNKIEFSKKGLGKNKFYEIFLSKLFFEGFAKNESQRSPETNKLIGKIKYLNGGLFLKHKIEIKYDGKIKIADDAFTNLFDLFDRYSWTLNDTPGGADNEMNPDVLGYIFEKYINQKAFGAYYTRTEITEYLCEQTVYKLILDAINEPEGLEQFLEKVPESMRKGVNIKPKRYDSIAELLLNLDAANCKKLVMGEEAILPNLSLLDPACGSGAFLVAAMKTLINVYAAVLGKIDFLGDKKLTEWKQKIETDHPSINYYIKKQIITNNLYGVDLMEEATEIAKLRLFLALVASADTVDQLEPLPNIDFNIMNGNSLIGLMRVDAGSFEKHQGQNLFRKSYPDLLREKNIAIQMYKNPKGIDDIQLLKNNIERHREEALPILDDMLMDEFGNLGIKYEQITWDENKNKEGKAVKRSLNINDIKALEPFHWGYEFSEIFKKKDGFDAIITNPPWEIFKPQDKEFFAPYSQTIKKNTQSIKEFEKEKDVLLTDEKIRKGYIEYLSKYPHQSQYFRSAKQFENQISIVNGKKAGSDVNLYKLFVEQCYNLLKKNGYCGIVIPSGIYSDLGTKQLRELLLNETEILHLISLSNERNLFEGVMHNFKFCLLSYKKDKPKDYFKASFRIYVHEAVSPDELDSFLGGEEFKLKIPIKVVKQFAPESLSIMEFKEEIDLDIAKKLIQFPMLGEELESTWNFKLSSEFHMTSDSHLFQTSIGKGRLTLYEGKMIHQFSHQFSNAQYWVNEQDGRKQVLKRGDTDTGQILEYQKYRLGTRAIGGSANERGLIATILHKNVFCGNSILLTTDKEVLNPLSNLEKLLLVSFFNSYPVDYCIRQMVATNINMFYIYQLHIPRLTDEDKWYKSIVERAARLICTTEEYAELWEETMQTKWNDKVAATNEYERNKLRAELDGIIAHIYGLTEEEFTYILSTFPVVPQPQKVAVQNAYRDVINGLIKPE